MKNWCMLKPYIIRRCRKLNRDLSETNHSCFVCGNACHRHCLSAFSTDRLSSRWKQYTEQWLLAAVVLTDCSIWSNKLMANRVRSASRLRTAAEQTLQDYAVVDESRLYSTLFQLFTAVDIDSRCKGRGWFPTTLYIFRFAPRRVRNRDRQEIVCWDAAMTTGNGDRPSRRCAAVESTHCLRPIWGRGRGRGFVGRMMFTVACPEKSPTRSLWTSIHPWTMRNVHGCLWKLRAQAVSVLIRHDWRTNNLQQTKYTTSWVHEHCLLRSRLFIQLEIACLYLCS